MFDREYDAIPTGLDEMEIGPLLAVILLTVDFGKLSGHDQVVVTRAQQRLASHFTARVYEGMAAVVATLDEADEHPMAAPVAAEAEIRAALCLTRQAAEAELAFALDLHRRLPPVWDALAAGAIDVRRAKLIAHRTTHLPIGTAREVVARILEDASHLTTGQLKARLDRLCLEADPDEARDRYQYAVKDRRLVAEPTSDGTAHLLGLDLPPHRVAAARRRIHHLAQSLHTSGETRTMDQLRADVFLDLLNGKTHRGTRTASGGVEIQVPLDTLTTVAEDPGELAGYGPVIADIARQVTTQQEDTPWRWTVTDPDSGQPVATGVTRRRPTNAQRRTIQTRDRTCIFPGCRMPAIDCDLDHRHRWADGGATTVANQAPLCRHDHPHKDQGGWRYRRLANGDYHWTSPLGHTYTTSGKPP